MTTLTTLVNFTYATGSSPDGSLIFDTAGDLLGTTTNGGASGGGTLFEIPKTASGYGNTAITLANLNTATGTHPLGTLSTDAAGDLFGSTASGGATGNGTVFELPKTGANYATAAVALASSSAALGPMGQNLATDDAGDLFGTTDNVMAGSGSVYELVKTGNGYASTPVALASFSSAQGGPPGQGLVIDSAGDLFGTAENSIVGGYVFKIAKTGSGYASTPTILASFNRVGGAFPVGQMTIDAAGNLFGTTFRGGVGSDPNSGTVFEVPRFGNSYENSVTTLFDLNNSTGANPSGTLIMDAAGNLFGTTISSAFELAKTGNSYTPTVLANFTGANGQYVYGGLLADAAGDLFGTTSYGGANGYGTVYELTNTGFVASTPTITGTVANQSVQNQTAIAPFAGVTISDSAAQVQTLTVTLSSAANGTLSNLGSGSYNASTGVYTDTGSAPAVTSALQGLVFNPVVTTGVAGTTTGFTISDTNTAGGSATNATTSVADINTSTVGAPVYRFYDPVTQAHFFTASASETANLQATDPGLTLEGTAFNAVNPTYDPSAVPVFRFYQSDNNTHFYTDNAAEAQTIVASHSDLTLEGTAFYVDPTMQAGDTAVYRFYETQSNTHLYTDNATEIAGIGANRPDLVLEGVAFYIKQ